MNRIIKFRAISEFNGDGWVYGDLRHYNRNAHTEKWTIHVPETGLETDIIEDSVGQFTGLYDRNGKEIYEGDILQFDDECGVWVDSVVFERGLFGLDIHPRQIKNPDDWDKPYSKVNSKWWSSKWGYEEYGTAFTYRRPLAIRTLYEGKNEDYENSEFYKIHKQHGFGKYYVFADIVGNIHETRN